MLDRIAAAFASQERFVADAARGEFILFYNSAYDRADWTLGDADGNWVRQGTLVFPWGAAAHSSGDAHALVLHRNAARGLRAGRHHRSVR